MERGDFILEFYCIMCDIYVFFAIHDRRFLVANPVNPGDIYKMSQSYDHWLVKIYFEEVSATSIFFYSFIFLISTDLTVFVL